MRINVQTETLTEARILCAAATELPVEGDFTIPDYRPEVLRILKAHGEPVIMQRMASGQKLVIEGYVKLSVLYTSTEGERLCSMLQKLPFSKQIDLKAPASEPCRVMVSAGMAYLNCRAVNSRRLDVRGAVTLCAQAVDGADAAVAADISGEGAQQRTGDVAFLIPQSLAEKHFTLEETLETLHPVTGEGDLLRCDRALTISSAECSDGDIIVSGTADLTLVTVDASGQLHSADYHIPFRQLLEAEAAEGRFSVSGSVVSTTFEGDGSEDNTLDVAVGCELSALICGDGDAAVVYDAFSTRYETEISTGQFTLLEGLRQLDAPFELAVMLGGPMDAAAEVVDSFACLSPVKVAEGAATVSGTACCAIRDQEGTRLIESPFELQVPADIPGEFLAELQSPLDSIEAVPTREGIELRARGRVCGELLCLRRVALVTGVKLLEDSPKKKPPYSLVVAFEGAGEDLWSLAKRYNTSPEAIAAENEQQAENGGRGPLLVPISD